MNVGERGNRSVYRLMIPPGGGGGPAAGEGGGGGDSRESSLLRFMCASMHSRCRCGGEGDSDPCRSFPLLMELESSGGTSISFGGDQQGGGSSMQFRMDRTSSRGSGENSD